MRRLFLTASALAMLAATPAVFAADAADPVVARINGTELHKSDVLAAQQQLPEQYRSVPLEMIYGPLLDRLIDSQLLVGQARKEKLENDPEVKAQMARLESDILRDVLLKKAVEAGETEAVMKAAYEKAKAKPDFAYEEVHAKHILVADEATATAIIAALDAGGDFAAIAKEKSTDPSGQQGGDLGFFKKEAMVPEFAEVAFTLAPGTYSKTPVKSQFGWHVIYVIEKRNVSPTFEQAEPELRQEVAREIVGNLLTEVRGGAKIEKFGLDGGPMPAAPAMPAAPGEAAPAAPAPAPAP